MSEPKHTPGPWLVDFELFERGRVSVVSEHGVPLEVAEVDGDTDEEVEANTRLIAAAPDLLEACRKAKEAFDLLGYDDGVAVQAVRAVLARFDGRPS